MLSSLHIENIAVIESADISFPSGLSVLTGETGAGKSMIARRIPGILPPLAREESMEVSAVYSVAGLLKESKPLIETRPVQSPHHTVTMTALTGGSVG